MLLFDFLGKIGGLNRLLWTLGAIILGSLYKDRLQIKIIESLFDCQEKGSGLSSFSTWDLLKRSVLCRYCKTKKVKQLDKTIQAGKK